MMEVKGKCYICELFRKIVLCKVEAEITDYQKRKKFPEKYSRFLLDNPN